MFNGACFTVEDFQKFLDTTGLVPEKVAGCLFYLHAEVLSVLYVMRDGHVCMGGMPI